MKNSDEYFEFTIKNFQSQFMCRQTRGSKWICHNHSDYCRWL